MNVKSGKQKTRKLAGACGLYCGACVFYRAYKDTETELIQKLAVERNVRPEEIACDGCLSARSLCRLFAPAESRECAFKKCTAEKKITWCFECDQFPCKTLNEFSHDGRAHHTAVIDNSREMKSLGVDEWLKVQEHRWQCPDCGKKLHWRTGYI